MKLFGPRARSQDSPTPEHLARPLRVGLNLLWLRPGQVGGSEHYIVRILDELARLDDADVEVRIYALRSFRDEYPTISARFRTVTAPVSGRVLSARVLAENTWLPWRVSRDGVDVMHHGGGTMPLLPGPRPCLTLHDLQYLDHPRYFSVVKRSWLGRVVPRSIRRAVVVITASVHTRQRVLAAVNVAENRVVVLPHVIPARASSSATSSEIPLPYVYFPAWTHPHKNHEVLLCALARVDGLNLAMSGGTGSAEAAVGSSIDRLGIGDRVHRLGHVNAARVEALYTHCIGLVFPSRYEGFGAPVVEAMVRGVPVVSSSATALAEVVGDGGLLVDPDDVDAWVAAMKSLADEAVRRALAMKGLERAADFAPAETVRAHVETWKRAWQGEV